MTRLVLRIQPGGDIKAVYNDALARMGLGPISVERASNVEFDSTTQEWVATRAIGGMELARGPSRDEVIRQEVQVLQDELREENQ